MRAKAEIEAHLMQETKKLKALRQDIVKQALSNAKMTVQDANTTANGILLDVSDASKRLADLEVQCEALKKHIATIIPTVQQQTGKDDIVQLNVGGVLYTTTQRTLSEVRVSFLSVLLSSKYNVRKDKQGAIFIDRSGHYFKYILEFLRNGSILISERDRLSIAHIRRELKYYSLPSSDKVFEFK